MDRQQRRQSLAAKMNIDIASDGTRYVTLEGIALGRLKQDPETLRWRYEWRAGWARGASELEPVETEIAETWAVDEIADMLAMEEHAPGGTAGK